MMKIAVIGANGQLGSDISAAFGRNKDKVFELNHDAFDICNLDACATTLKSLAPDLVINTAAYHNVDKCESNVNLAFEVNAGGARNLARLSADMGFRLYHISTDYVFDGNKKSPYLEYDAVCPLNVYGNSKAAGDFFVRTMSTKSLVVRVSGIYGTNPCRAKGGLNFVQLMLKLSKEKPEIRVVDNEFLTPTPTKDIAEQLVKISRTDIHGIAHATAEGSCSWYEFAREIFSFSGITTPLNAASPGEFPIKTARPTYSVLENDVLKKAGINIMKPWQEGLKEYLKG